MAFGLQHAGFVSTLSVQPLVAVPFNLSHMTSGCTSPQELGMQPYALLWLRYTAFLVLYPLGVGSELAEVALALPSIRARRPWSIQAGAGPGMPTLLATMQEGPTLIWRQSTTSHKYCMV
jgi:hypothetical protein